MIKESLFFYKPLDVQAFLIQKNSFLKDYKISDSLFSEYVECMCCAFDVNPKLILVSLQREQGLISKSITPSEDVLKRALGVGCYDDRDINTFYGFQHQIDGCIDTYVKWFYSKIVELKIDDKLIKPDNRFIYTLYKYTPHEESLKLTCNIWKGYWKEDFEV